MHKSVGRWVPVLAVLAGCWSTTSDALAGGEPPVDLLWSPSTSVVGVGDTFEIDLIARATTPNDQIFSGVEAIMTWDPTVLRLIQHRDEPVSSGGYDWLLSSFPSIQVDNLNDTFADGNALYQALGQFSDPFPTATQSGFLVTHMVFEALRTSSLTQLSIPESIGTNTSSIVASGITPGLNVLGSTGTANITVVPEPTTAALLAVLSTGMLWRRRRAARRGALTPSV